MRMNICTISKTFARHFVNRHAITCMATALAFAVHGISQSITSASPVVSSGHVTQTPDGLAGMLATQPMNEETLQRTIVEKSFYLRGMFLGNSLAFDPQGKLEGSSPRGSYTLALVQINKARLSKKKLELYCTRYGLHFLGPLPTEDLLANSDKVRITPKKKVVRIVIERQQIVKPKKQHRRNGKGGGDMHLAEQGAVPQSSPSETRTIDDGVGPTTSLKHADELLRSALDKILAPTIDERLIASMPMYWQEYFSAATSKREKLPSTDSAFLQSNVDQKARLTVPIVPESNQFAQDGGIAGMALYRALIESNGKAGRVAVARPIGFGLDENAVAAIHQAKFEPAIKDGKTVPVWVDLVVQFRIYSKRTNVAARPEDDANKGRINLPGPYSLPHI